MNFSLKIKISRNVELRNQNFDLKTEILFKKPKFVKIFF